MFKGLLYLATRIVDRPSCIEQLTCSFCSVIVGIPGWLLPPHYPSFSAPMIMFSLLPCRRYLNQSPEDQDEDLPGLEEDTFLELDSTVLRRRTMAAAAERRMQTHPDPAP